MRKNTTGIKILKSLLFFLVGAIVLVLITPTIFSIGGSIITSLPFETPTSFIIADYIGMFMMFLEGIVLLIYTKKWMWK